MSGPDLASLLQKAKAMQEKMGDLQRELSGRKVEGNAGGGLVTAVASGDMRIVGVTIDPSLAESPDLAMISDLVTAAVNAALQAAQTMVQEEMQRATAGALPFGFGGGDPS